MKTALIGLIILLICSLATSGYLLMEQSNSTTIIKTSQKEVSEQKKKTLTATELKINAEQSNARMAEELKTAATQLTELTNNLAKTELDFQLANDEQVAELAANKTEIEKIQSQLSEAKSIVDKSGEMQKENATLRLLTNSQKEALARRKKELDVALESLNLFSATGLSPEEINTLKQKRPIEIGISRTVLIKPIRPGKITIPIQNNSP